MKQTSRAYILSHNILKNEIYNNWKEFSVKLNQGPDSMREYMCNMWNSITENNIKSDFELIDLNRKVTKEDFNITTAVFHGIRVFFIIFPEPDHNFAQAKCVALVLSPNMPKYFTMEITELDNNKRKYMVCEWRVENGGFIHNNFGPMNLNTIDEFAGYINTFIEEDLKYESQEIIGLKPQTLNLIDVKTANFIDVFSICAAKVCLVNKRFKEYIGNYSKWATDVKIGKLMLDNRQFDVEYIGTTMPEKDNMWFSAELEDIIPDQYVSLTINTRKAMQKYGFNELTQGKIPLDNIDGRDIAIINCAMCLQKVAYFCGSGETNIYMFVKNLPQEIFRKVELVEFSTVIMDVISSFNVNHKLVVKAFLIENGIEYTENEEMIIGKYSQESTIIMKFQNDRLISCDINKLS